MVFVKLGIILISFLIVSSAPMQAGAQSIAMTCKMGAFDAFGQLQGTRHSVSETLNVSAPEFVRWECGTSYQCVEAQYFGYFPDRHHVCPKVEEFSVPTNCYYPAGWVFKHIPESFGLYAKIKVSLYEGMKVGVWITLRKQDTHAWRNSDYVNVNFDENSSASLVVLDQGNDSGISCTFDRI